MGYRKDSSSGGLSPWISSAGSTPRPAASLSRCLPTTVDPVKVSYCAVRNAGSVAALILTTQTLIAKKPDDYDITAGPARGGGAELLGRA